MKNKKFLPFIISAVIVVIGIASLIFQGLNLGIDFRSGKIITVDFGKELDTKKLEEMVAAAGGKDAVIRKLDGTAYSIHFYVDEDEFSNISTSTPGSSLSPTPGTSPENSETAGTSPSAAATPDASATGTPSVSGTPGAESTASSGTSASASNSASASASVQNAVNPSGYSVVEARLANMLYDYFRSILAPEYSVTDGVMTYKLNFGVNIDQEAFKSAVSAFLSSYTADYSLSDNSQAEIKITLSSMSFENMLGELLLYNVRSSLYDFDLAFDSYEVKDGKLNASVIISDKADTQALIDSVVGFAGEDAKVSFEGRKANISFAADSVSKEKVTAELLTAKMSELLSFESEGSDSTVSGEVTAAAFWTVLLAAVCMLGYIWYRFELHSGIAAIAGLLHDIIVTVTVMSLFQIQLNATFIAALLTIVGYVINNTIIIFDRIRENSKKITDMSNYDIARLSVKQSIRRTLFASVTTLLTVGMLFILGVTSVKNFTLPIIVGILSSMYTSTLFSPLVWSLLKDRADKKRG